MLSSFSVENYLGFKGPVSLSLRALSITENQETLIDGSYLPAVGIFGPNSSGKSVFLSALRNVVEYLSLPLLSEPCLAVDTSPSFEIRYTYLSHIFRYSLSFRGKVVQYEKLEKAESEDKRFTLLFERSFDSVRYHSSVRAAGYSAVPSDIPLFTILRSDYQENEVLAGAFRGLESSFVFPGMIKDKKRALEEDILRSFGFGASDDGDGVKELRAVLPVIADALENGRIAVIDNLTPSLHPALRRGIIRLFTDRGINTNGASILFSSQDVTLLDTSLLRRDEIYFTEKEGGNLSLYRLTDVRGDDGQAIRKDARLMKGYEEGLFGAYPEVTKLERRKTEKRSKERKLFSINNRRYLGNKFRITRFIREVIDENCKEYSSFADIFSGTGSVSYAFRDKKLILNDFLYSNYLANLAWFSPEHFDSEKIESLICHYNSIVPESDNYFSDNFSDTYFSRTNCRKVGEIREDIEKRYRKGELNMREKAILVVSLLYAIDRIAATCGHYDAWRENADLSHPLELRMLDADCCNNEDNQIYSEDSNELVKHIKADVVYIDPPYNSRQYSDAYHLLENVARWEKPAVSGKARKMDRKDIKSRYSTTEAEAAFKALINDIDARYIVLSYNNMQNKGDSRSNAKISDETILSALSAKGEVRIFSTSHKAFSAGKSHIDDNEERLFLCTVRRKEMKKGGYVESPLNYTGGKGRIIKELLEAFPAEIDTFVDLFAGGCTVGANVNCRRVIFNDSDPRLMSLLREMRRSDKESFIEDIRGVIRSYGLSESDRYGYEYYGADSSKGLGSVNKEGYLSLRSDFNTLSLDEHRRAVMLYVLIIFGFNNQIRFNDEGAFNLPVGKRDFNQRMQQKLASFIDRIKSLDAVFLDSDFRTVEIPSGSFVYADPPYLVTTATYNERHGWTESDETSLHALLENLTERGIRFALSNTLESRGKVNTFLLAWLGQHPEYRVLHINRSYANSNYHIKDREAESDEVLILNY